MYSGSTLTPLSGRVIGAHQKIDRLARFSLKKLAKHTEHFPKTRSILHFEGYNGPDAIKRKSPAQDEPWHYMSPFDQEDTQLVDLVEMHYDELVKALKSKNSERAAFEAAWLSHAIVDGLTPAHHYPYEEKLVELYGGQSIENRVTIKEKLVIPGETRRQQVGNNWKMWGPKGLFTTHYMFEWGVAVIIAPIRARQIKITEHDISELYEFGVLEYFRLKAREVAGLDMYTQFYSTGWTRPLANRVRKHLAPILVKTVALIWYAAMIDAGLTEKKKI